MRHADTVYSGNAHNMLPRENFTGDARSDIHFLSENRCLRHRPVAVEVPNCVGAPIFVIVEMHQQWRR